MVRLYFLDPVDQLGCEKIEIQGQWGDRPKSLLKEQLEKVEGDVAYHIVPAYRLGNIPRALVKTR